MTAQEFVYFLERYIAEKPPNFGDGDSVLTLLYEAYNDANNMDSDDIKAGFRDLYKSMNGMPLREMDTIVNPVCALCRTMSKPDLYMACRWACCWQRN